MVSVNNILQITKCINSSLHQKNAKDDAKWKHVDTLIARGPTLAEMEERLLRKKAEMQGGKP